MNQISYLNASINHLIKQFAGTQFARNASSKSFVMNRQSKTLNKLLVGKVKSKKQWRPEENTPKLPSITSLTDPVSHGKSSQRRVNVLNKLFMRHITDFMATDGTFSGYGLEISRVKITTDFRLVNVFWIARGDGSDAHLESILFKSAGPLRHNLSQLRLMGEVPTIKFVKDKSYAKSVEVETLLRCADFGDDFVPSTPAQMIRNDLTGDTIRSDNAFPEMTHNILGLNQAEIMHRIKQNMTKAKQAWEKYETKLPPTLEEKYASTGEDRTEAIIRLKEEEFQAFLKQRKSGKHRERRPRANVDGDDEDDEDDSNLFEEEDTFDEEFEIPR